MSTANQEQGREQAREQGPAGRSDDAMPSLVVRRILIGFGWIMVVLGVIGVFLPVVPTAPFVIVAAWAFSRSSQRFHDWLYMHPRLGPPLRAWRSHRVIPWHAKALSIGGMWGSLGLVIAFIAEGWMLPAAHATIILAVSAYILSRPSSPPLG
ncbi:MAG TPA: YbaN family protein [Arenibaculum sp.]|nr:YbaN family protein [Arenibaculum sp.]